MVQPIAVLFVHGVEVRDPRYADAAISRLRREFAKHVSGRDGADRALVIEPAYWIPVVAGHEDRVLARTFQARTTIYRRVLDGLVAEVDAGSLLALVPLGAAGLLRQVPGTGGLHYPALRWAMTYFLGDAIAYQLTSQQTSQEGRQVYDKIHDRIDIALHSLAKRRPRGAPLRHSPQPRHGHRLRPRLGRSTPVAAAAVAAESHPARALRDARFPVHLG